MATQLGEFRDPGVCQIVTELTVDTDGQWMRATIPGQLDELMNDASFFAYISSSTGAVLETAADGLRVSASALGTTLTGGGASVIDVADGSITEAKLGTSAVTSAKLANNAVTTSNIQDIAVTFAKLAPDAVTNLSTTVTPTETTVNCSTGTNAVLQLAGGAVTSGLVAAEDRQKLADTIWVTDSQFAGGADPTGQQDSTLAVQAAIDYAVANKIHYVRFPLGDYQVNGQVNLPISTANLNYRLTIDFGNSKVTSNTTGRVFGRIITLLTDTVTDDYSITFCNGKFVQTNAGAGTLLELHACSNVMVENLNVSSFKTVLRFVFCLHHNVRNVNVKGCIEPFIVKGGDGEFADGTSTNSNSNIGTWINVRSQTTSSGAIAFQCSNSSNITYIGCVAEGTAISNAWAINGNQGSGRAPIRDIKLIHCWIEGVTIADAIIAISDVEKSVLSFQIHGGSLPGDPLFCKLTGQTQRNVIEFRDTTIFNENNSQVGPWFDAGILAVATQQNYWKFNNCIVGTGRSFEDTDRWQTGSNGTVPTTLKEDAFSYNDNARRESVLTSAPNTVLLNADAVNTQLVKGTTISSLPTVTTGANTYALIEDASGNVGNVDLSAATMTLQGNPEITSAPSKDIAVGALPTQPAALGSRFIGWDAGGLLAEFDPLALTATSRKSDIDNLGTQSTGTLAVDWDAGNFDNKQITLGADLNTVTFTATRSGKYTLHVVEDGTGFRKLNLSSVNASPRLTNVALDYASGAITVIEFNYNNSTGIWSW